MKLTRLRTVLLVTVLGGTVLIGTAACGSDTTSATANTTTPEEVALTAVGFPAADGSAAATATPSPGATGAPARARRHPRLRAMLRANVEHGEVVVKTQDGTKTVDVQRGTVTAAGGTTVTVRSDDGFTLTWRYGESIRVVENRTKVSTGNVKVGETIGVAGVKKDGTPTAQLVLIRHTP